ncbi:hypothetical protein C4513_08970 [Morganella morganii]|nr:hypothetical protein LR61_10085 [Morganella morganii]MQC05958.1 hypothetical protein [Morganella morganii]MQC11028.1 hypothetical protein [Morganella morganii]MQC13735.1 hypothetical protein [Morganella morganii]
MTNGGRCHAFCKIVKFTRISAGKPVIFKIPQSYGEDRMKRYYNWICRHKLYTLLIAFIITDIILWAILSFTM